MWFFTADLHLGHNNIIKYCNRPFMNWDEQQFFEIIKTGQVPISELKISEQSTKKMDDQIIQSINDTVGQDDHLVIIGDFCFAKSKDKKEKALKYRRAINCKNVYLIYGNHDDKKILHDLFTLTADSYTFHVDNEIIFCSHYPCRSWNKKSYGAWMLYGHVHGLLSPNDCGELTFMQLAQLEDAFNKVSLEHNIESIASEAYKDVVINFLAEKLNFGTTMDVGIDNRYKRENRPYGMPWSMDELKLQFRKKAS